MKLPFTCKKAKPASYEIVVDANVIEVIDAHYRKATFSGRFVLSPFVQSPIPNNGTGKIDVLCKWFDHRLATTGLSLIVDFSKVVHFPNYSGEVVNNLGK